MEISENVLHSAFNEVAMKRILLSIVIVLVLFVPAFAQFGDDFGTGHALKRILDKTATFESDENNTFQDLVDHLKKDFGIDVQWDTKNIASLGITLDSPVVREPVKYNGIKIRNALRLLLSESDLTFQIKDGKLLITTEEEAKKVNSIKVGMWVQNNFPPGSAIPEEPVKPLAFFSESKEMRQLRATLEKHCSLSLDENNTFEDLFNILKDEQGIQAYIDPVGAGALGITTSSPIVREPFSIENIPLRRLLRLVLGEQDLTFVIDDGFLLITSQDDARKHMKIRVYDVADLVEVVEMNEAAGGERQRLTTIDFSELMDLIESVVSPESWSANGGDAEMMEFYNGRCLVVLQTDEVHEQLEQQLFPQLRELVQRRKEKTDAR